MVALFTALADVWYTPFPHFNGLDSITYNVTDQLDPVSWASNLTNLVVIAANDAPTLAFANASYSTRAFQVSQAVPVMLPTVALGDVDAADSPYAMTLTVRARFGTVELAAPFDLGRAANLDPLPSSGGGGNVNGMAPAGSRLVLTGSLAQLRRWVNAVRFTSATAADAQSGVNALFPLFANDTITYTVTDGGASAPPVYLGAPAALTATLVLSIAVQPAPNAPTIVTTLDSPLRLTEDVTFGFSAQTLRLAYVDGAPGAILHTVLTVSGEAATHGMRLAVASPGTGRDGVGFIPRCEEESEH